MPRAGRAPEARSRRRGYTATDFNGHSGAQTVAEGTDAVVGLATIGADGPTGALRDRHGALGW
ncbi:hypothetical protein QF032_006877 [Streptomyces achromogenes]|uniref:Uncharacterized protein n=1 Tax=Streptomyces achromogenes TaxID=67255 RepID=A0ABU0QAY9_STRAH|nr:hypothetical protein [Streptomyces achromogenes]MDQ0835033.1 hypothetical protein [Streptomyces achromogenes]